MELAVNAGARGRRPAGVERLSERRGHPAHEEKTARIGMAVFLGSWAMLFVALFFSYGLVRARTAVWPPLDQPRLPLLLPGINTLVIAASSAAMVMAERFPGLRRRAVALASAAALGGAFLALQALVWVRLWREGLVPSGGPYPSVFYALTAFHALHVLVGLAALAVLAARAARGRASWIAVRLWGMYWHFVGVIWLALYAAVYVA